MLLLLAMALAIDTTHTVRIVVAPGESLVVSISGEGQPVVMLPGLFGSGYAYRHVREGLDAAGFQSITIDPLGMGSSSRPAEADYSLTAQSDRVAAVLDSLGVGSAYVVGHSHGASIAMRLAYRRPDLVQGIVSIEGGPSEAIMSGGMRAAMRFAPVLRMVNGQGLVMRRIIHDMREQSEDPDWVTREVVLEYVAGMALDFGATMAAYQAMAGTDEPELLVGHLPEIDCPVVVLISEKRHGRGIPEEELATLIGSLRDLAVDTVISSGFFIHEEQPGRVVAAVESLVVRPIVESP